MHEILLDFLIDLLKWLTLSYGLGFTFTIALWGILDSLGIQFRRDRKGKCWISISLIIFGLCALHHVLR